MIRLTIQGPQGVRTLGGSRAEILVGSRKDIDIPLEDGGVGAVHCLLRAEGGSYRLVDLGGPGGVKVNGRPARESLLRVGDTIALGSHTIRIDTLGEVAPLALAGPAPPHAPRITHRVRAAAASDFEREIRRLVKQAPWWMVSLAVHGFLLFVLSLLTVDPSEPPGARVLNTSAGREQDVAPDERPSLADSPAAPEPLAPDIEDPMRDLVPPANPSEIEGGSPEEPAPTEDRSAIGAGADWLKHRFPKLQPFNPKKKGPGSPMVPKSSDRAQSDAARTVEARLGGEVGRIRGQLRPDQLLVLRGEYDNIELVLLAFGLPHQLIDRPELLKRALRADQILFINCGIPPAESEQRPYVEKVRAFVQRGGWLMTSDWALEPYVTEGFAREVGVVLKKHTRYQPDVVVEAEFCDGADGNPLVKDIFAGRAHAPWWLEKSSTFFTFQRNTIAQALVKSRQLDEKYGVTVIAFTFTTSGGGRGAHLVGHFHQKTEHADGIAGMQHLILNFVRMKYPSPE